MNFKRDARARHQLLSWLGAEGVIGLPSTLAEADHLVAATAAALATWTWKLGESVWVRVAKPPQHPFDFAC